MDQTIISRVSNLGLKLISNREILVCGFEGFEENLSGTLKHVS